MSQLPVPRQVLIVEDDAQVRDALREVFTADGYQTQVLIPLQSRVRVHRERHHRIVLRLDQ